MGQIKILVLNPVATDRWNDLTLSTISKIASPNTYYEVKSLSKGPKSIETYYDKELVVDQVVKEAYEAEKKGYDAMIINCFDDPGLHASREVVNDMLVLGIGETSIISSLLLGNSIAIISTGRNTKGIYRRRVLELGIKDRVVYIGAIEVPVLDLRDDEEIKKLLSLEINNALDRGAEVIILGCSGFTGLGKELSKAFKVPVIDPFILTFKIAEALSAIGIKHSKFLSYSPPPHKMTDFEEYLRVDG